MTVQGEQKVRTRGQGEGLQNVNIGAQHNRYKHNRTEATVARNWACTKQGL